MSTALALVAASTVLAQDGPDPAVLDEAGAPPSASVGAPREDDPGEPSPGRLGTPEDPRAPNGPSTLTIEQARELGMASRPLEPAPAPAEEASPLPMLLLFGLLGGLVLVIIATMAGAAWSLLRRGGPSEEDADDDSYVISVDEPPAGRWPEKRYDSSAIAPRAAGQNPSEPGSPQGITLPSDPSRTDPPKDPRPG